MPQTTTDYGKQNISWPDLGYDAGANLHTEIVSSVAKFSDQINTVWSGVQVISASGTFDVTHNFNLSLSSLRVRLVESNAELDIAGEADFAVSQVDVNTIRVTNNDSVSRTIEIYVAPILRIREGDIDPSLNLGAYEVINITGSTYTIEPNNGTNLVENTIFRIAGTNDKTITCNNTSSFTFENCKFEILDNADITFTMTTSGLNLILSNSEMFHQSFSGNVIVDNTAVSLALYNSNLYLAQNLLCQVTGQFYAEGGVVRLKTLETRKIQAYDSSLDIDNLILDNTANITDNEFEQCVVNINTLTQSTALNNYIYFRGSKANINKLLIDSGSGTRRIYNIDNSYFHITSVQAAPVLTVYNGDQVNDGATPPDTRTAVTSYLFIGETIRDAVDIRSGSTGLLIENMAVGDDSVVYRGDKKLFDFFAGYTLNDGGNFTLSDSIIKYQLFNFDGGAMTLQSGVTEFQNCKFYAENINININNNAGNISFYSCDFTGDNVRGITFNNGTANNLLFYNCNFGQRNQTIAITGNRIDFYQCTLRATNLNLNTTDSNGFSAYDSSIFISTLGRVGTPTVKQDINLDNTYFSCNNITDTATIDYNIKVTNQSHFVSRFVNFQNTSSVFLIDNNSQGKIAELTTGDTTTNSLTVGSNNTWDNTILELGRITNTQARFTLFGQTSRYLKDFDKTVKISNASVSQTRISNTIATVNTTNDANISATATTIQRSFFNVIGDKVYFDLLITITAASDNTETITNINVPTGFGRNVGQAVEIFGTIQPRISTSNVSFNGKVEGDVTLETIKLSFYGSAISTQTQYVVSGIIDTPYTTARQ